MAEAESAPAVPHLRRFPGVRLEAGLEADLRAAQQAGFLTGYSEDADGLTVIRRRLQGEEFGKDYPTIFQGGTPGDWLTYSSEIFPRIVEALAGCAHGALHPGNVRHRGRSPLILDFVGNRARLGGRAERGAEDYAVWLWAPEVFPDWTFGDWDLLSVVRMVTLLAQGPEAWGAPMATADVVTRCRTWLDVLVKAGTGGVDTTGLVTRSEELLTRLPTGGRTSASVPAPGRSGLVRLRFVEARLAELFDGRGGNRILRAVDEDAMERDLGPGDPADPPGRLIRAALLRLQGIREDEALEQAEGFLRAGIYRSGPARGAGAGAQLVRPGACRTGERLLAQYGMTESSAAGEIASLLHRRGWKDGRLCRAAWRKAVRQAAGERCRNGTYTLKQYRAFTELATAFGFPVEVAETEVRVFLEELGLVPADGTLRSVARRIGLLGLAGVLFLGICLGVGRACGLLPGSRALAPPASFVQASSRPVPGGAPKPDAAAPPLAAPRGPDRTETAPPAAARRPTDGTLAVPQTRARDRERSEDPPQPGAPRPGASTSPPASPPPQDAAAPAVPAEEPSTKSAPSRAVEPSPATSKAPLPSMPPAPQAATPLVSSTDRSVAAPPVIDSFEPYPPAVEQCGMVLLRWTIRGGEAIAIEPQIGAVQGKSGYRILLPPVAGGTFTLTAKGPGGLTRKTARVEVRDGPRTSCGQ